MGFTRFKKEKRAASRVYAVTFSVLFFSFLVFSLITPEYTGFAVLEAQSPDEVTLFLSKDIFSQGEVIRGDLEVTVDGPIDETSFFYASVGGNGDFR